MHPDRSARFARCARSLAALAQRSFQHEAFLCVLDTSSEQLGAILGVLEPFWIILGSFSRPVFRLGADLASPAAISSRFGVISGRLGAYLARLGPILVRLGAIWVHLGAILRPS